MMIGDSRRPHPTVHVPPWDLIVEDPTAIISSPTYGDALAALQRYLPSNDDFSDDIDFPTATFSGDNFRMYEFKVRRCLRGRSHDWTECPYAHPGEKARRRDPRRYSYSGTACPEFRKGNCRKGESCEFAHGVFECWLHPTRYRTQPCKDGTGCRRRVCFFAHTPEQLRVLSPAPESYDGSSPLPESYDGSVFRRGFVASPPISPPMSPSDSLSYNSVFQPLSPTPVSESFTGSPFRRGFFSGSPESPPCESPPMSPSDSLSYNSVREVVSCMRNLQLSKVMGFGSGSISPRGSMMTRPGFSSLPTTPTRAVTRSGLGYLDSVWNSHSEEEPVMERVESGRDLRAKIYAKLSKENSLDRVDSVNPGPGQGPDVGWVSELVK